MHFLRSSLHLCLLSRIARNCKIPAPPSFCTANTLNVPFIRSTQTMARRDSKYYFQNPYADFTPGAASEIITADGNLSDSYKVKSQLSQKWNDYLNRVRGQYSRDYTVYTGNAGIALVKLRQSPHDPEVLHELSQVLEASRLRGRDCTFLCGDAGPLAIGAVVADRQGKPDVCKKLVDDLNSLGNEALDTRSDLPNEYLYGRAGYLYALLYVNKYCSQPLVPDKTIRDVIAAILTAGQQLSSQMKCESPLMYIWHDSYYLGAAHGLSGILYLLMLAHEYLPANALHTLIKPSTDYLLTLRFKSGNLPSSLGSNSDKYVQWCHGSPGFVYLFAHAAKLFDSSKYMKAALKCADVIWERGLLTKGYSLCHGVSGNAYCFLELYQHTKDNSHLYRALKFAEWCVDYTPAHELHQPDRPLSLYEGISGPMYLLLDIQKPMEAKFPGFSL